MSIYMLQHYLTNNFNNMNYMKISVASTLLFLTILIVAGITGRHFFLGEGGERRNEKKKSSVRLH